MSIRKQPGLLYKGDTNVMILIGFNTNFIALHMKITHTIMNGNWQFIRMKQG
jgi:hypothetical protein